MDANKILLQSLYKKIIIEFSRATGKDLEESMDYFYNSTTYDLISNGVGDIHCRGVKYLTDELLLEYGMMVAPNSKQSPSCPSASAVMLASQKGQTIV